jgi:hypothetical protein
MKTLLRQEDLSEIRQRLARIKPDSPRKWGRMSAHQMICHLADSFRAGLGDKTPSPIGTLFDHIVVKPIALYAPIHWPKGLSTRPEMDQERAGTKPLEFAEDVAHLEALLERFTRMGENPGTRHPLFGTMTRSEWQRWGYLHRSSSEAVRRLTNI